ncbi:MAG: transcriptional regulator Dnr [Methyloligellaceae bacterium]
MDQSEWALIKSAPLFEGVADEAVRRLVGNQFPKRYEKGHVIFQQGEPADAFFFILEGWVKAYRAAPSGAETIVCVFSRGESFAEAAMFNAGTYPVSAETVCESRLLRIDAANFRRLVHEEPDLALSMLASCSKHLKYLVEQLEQIKHLSAPHRIANFLVNLCSCTSGDCTITLPYEKALIANRLAMQPESFSRAMMKLKPLGVEVERERVSIKDVGRLIEFVASERDANLSSCPG